VFDLIKDWLASLNVYETYPQGSTPERFILIAEDGTNSTGRITEYSFLLTLYARDQVREFSELVLEVLRKRLKTHSEISDLKIDSVQNDDSSRTTAEQQLTMRVNLSQWT
jgi:hypothetical protein